MGQLSGVGVLDKSVAVLDAAAHAPVGLAELVEATGLPRATAHRLAVALEAHRLLVRDEAGRWVPGPRLAELARSAPDPLLAAHGRRPRSPAADDGRLRCPGPGRLGRGGAAAGGPFRAAGAGRGATARLGLQRRPAR